MFLSITYLGLYQVKFGRDFWKSEDHGSPKKFSDRDQNRTDESQSQNFSDLHMNLNLK